jgi:hypothetical protein
VKIFGCVFKRKDRSVDPEYDDDVIYKTFNITQNPSAPQTSE